MQLLPAWAAEIYMQTLLVRAAEIYVLVKAAISQIVSSLLALYMSLGTPLHMLMSD